MLNRGPGFRFGRPYDGPSSYDWFDQWRKPKEDAGPKEPSLEDTMKSQAAGIEAEERRRYDQGLGTLSESYRQSQRELTSPLDTGLLFSRASDAIGARSAGQMNAIRSSLGARGLNPNSGVASGMLSRLQYQREGATTGATRDIAIEDKRRREVNAAVSFANALQLANYTQSPVSGVGLETTQNLFEGQIAREGIASQERSNKRASKANKASSVGGALFNAIPGL